MKKAIFGALVFLISIFVQVPASASTDGCPDSWSIDLTKFPNNPELFQAKKNLGPKMVEAQIKQVIVKYKGEQGDMPEFSELGESVGILRFSYQYLYGKSEVETTWKVEVKDCPNPGVFKFKHLLSENRFTMVEQTTAANWANSHENSFTDFKKQQNFATELSQANIKSQELVDKRRQISSGKSSILLTSEFFPLAYGAGNLFGKPWNYLSLQALTPKCLGPSKLIKSMSELIFGQKCKFAWSLLERLEPNNPNNQDMKLVMFEPFEIDASFKSSRITCVKSNATKTITGSNPKCPAGYQRK